MPVVFEQPGPVSPSLSAAQGYADTYAKLFPSIASLYGHMASINAAQQSQVGAGYQQAQQFQASQRQQQDMQTQQLQAQANMQGSEAGYQSDLQNQKAQNEAWLNQQQLTQADQMRLMRMQQAVSAVQNDMDKGVLSPDEGNAMMTKLRTGIDPLMMRQEKSRADLIQAQKQHFTDQHAMMLSAQKNAAEFAANFVQNGIATIPDPNNPGRFTQHIPHFDKDGIITEWKPIKNEGGAGSRDALQEKKLLETHIEAEARHDDRESANWEKGNKEALAQIEKDKGEHIGKDESGPRLTDRAKAMIANEIQDSGVSAQEARRIQLMNDAGYGSNREAYLERMRQRREQHRNQLMGITGPNPHTTSPTRDVIGRTEGANQGTGEGGSLGLGATGGAGGSKAKPFNMAKPAEGKEQDLANRVSGMIRTVNSLGLTSEKQLELARPVMAIRRLLEETGGTENMTPEQYQKYIEFTNDYVKRKQEAIREQSKRPPTTPFQPNPSGGFMAVPRY